jgi:hypothetical protein
VSNPLPWPDDKVHNTEANDGKQLSSYDIVGLNGEGEVGDDGSHSPSIYLNLNHQNDDDVHDIEDNGDDGVGKHTKTYCFNKCVDNNIEKSRKRKGVHHLDFGKAKMLMINM